MRREDLHRLHEALEGAIGRMRRAEEASINHEEPFIRGQGFGLATARRELGRVRELVAYALEDAAYTDAVALREARAMAAELAESDHD